MTDNSDDIGTGADTGDDTIYPQRNPFVKILSARSKTVNLIFERAGREVDIYREVDLGTEDAYGKEDEDKIWVGTEPAIMYYPGTSPGGARPDRREERYGERVYWEPHMFFRFDADVQEKDIIHFPMPRYPENQGGKEQLWELETLIPYETHIHTQLQRFVEQ